MRRCKECGKDVTYAEYDGKCDCGKLWVRKQEDSWEDRIDYYIMEDGYTWDNLKLGKF